MMNLIIAIGNFVEVYALEIAIVALVVLYIVQLINVKSLRELLSKR
jgi:hypothetical protein